MDFALGWGLAGLSLLVAGWVFIWIALDILEAVFKRIRGRYTYEDRDDE